MGRLSRDENRQFKVKEGDTIVLSSHPIPGNEEVVSRTINKLFRRGAKVIYDPIASVHVSGHASVEEMKHLLELLQPKHLIPIHGELRHLNQHANVAVETGIVKRQNIAVIENGQIVEFDTEGNMNLGERIPGDYIFVDGAGVGDIGPSVVRERDILSREGFFLVNLILDKKSGQLLQDPEIITRGFVYKPESQDLIDDVADYVVESLEKKTSGDLEKSLEKAVKNFLYKELQRRPMVFVSVHAV
jgi:ribonuclease J